MKQMALNIDHGLCWGCMTCEVACKQEMKAPDGVRLIRVTEDGPKEVDGTLDFVFHVNLCRHCEVPPCAEACPEHAIYKRDDGIVVLDVERCTGCSACMEECPYDAIAFDATAGVARKCNLCHHRVDQGLLPACADNVCPAHCIHFPMIPPCFIFIDSEGRWFHKGAEMIHREIIRFFYDHMELDRSGRYMIRWGEERCFLEVQDTALVVRKVAFHEEGGIQEFRLFLSDDTHEALIPETLFTGEKNVLYCKVKNGKFPARFHRPAYYQLADFVEEHDGRFYLPLNGRKHPLRQ
jgi:uncharacterized protein